MRILVPSRRTTRGLLLLLGTAFFSPSEGYRPVSKVSNLPAHKVLVLGHTGFLGKEIVSQLQDLNIPFITGSKSDSLDLTADSAQEKVAKLAEGCDSVISCVGSIGTENDEKVNASNGVAAKGAKDAGVSRFVTIGNDPKVREFSRNLPMLQKYTSGKESAESVIKEAFPDTYTIVAPSFIHGGESFGAFPPRVPSNLGQIAEDVLGLYPFQAASEALPGALGLVLQAPISRQRVAAAAINAALGLAQGDLSSRDDILQAASKRPQKEVSPGDEVVDEINVEDFQQQLYALGDCQGEQEKLDKAFELLEMIEDCNERSPTTDPIVNGRWDFVMDIEADIGTGIVKDIMSGNSPIKFVFSLDDLYMVIEKNSIVTILVQTKVLNLPVELKLTTELIPDNTDATGTSFLEKFRGIKLNGNEFPVPAEWQRSRPLELSYLDETMLIARGNGGEPHYLKRGSD